MQLAALALENAIKSLAQRFTSKRHALFLERGRHYPIALEGALNLKEISYIHAEAYPLGELKHGPFALVDASMSLISLAPNGELHEKLKSNLQEVRSQRGELYVFADWYSEIPECEGMHIMRMPEHYGLFPHRAALFKGTYVDKPRNLAKSVTV